MANDNNSSEDRELPASQRRLEKAAERGQVARSRDLGHLSAIAAAMTAFALLGAGVADKLVASLRAGLTIPHTLAFDPALLADRIAGLTGRSFGAVLPLMLAIVGAVIVAAMLPGGPTLTLHPLRLDVSRVSPFSGMRRIFAVTSLTDLTKLALISLALGVAGTLYLSAIAPQFVQLARVELNTAMIGVGGLIRNGGWTLCGVLLLAALVDVPLQWFRLRNSLKMTHQDVREEHKETEGDPRIKARIRSLQMQMRRNQMMAAVPRADVIITNPTHYAVAIRYDEGGSAAPVVIAKGVDHLATRIREIAQAHDIPFVEAPPLARALYRHVDIDQQIPAALYQAVAQVLAYIYQLRQWRSGKGRAPIEPTRIPIPPGLDPDEASA